VTKLVGPADAAYCLYSVLPLDWIFALVRVNGRFTYFVRRRQRSTVERNLTSVFGATKTPSEIDLLTRRFFEYKRERDVLMALAPRLTEAEIARLLPIEGLEHLDTALDRRQGVILLLSHLNSLCGFLLVILLRKRGYDVRAAIPEQREPLAPSAFGRFLHRRFKTKPVSELMGAFYAQLNIRPIVRCLRDNVVVAQTGDGLHSAGFVEVAFLGRRIPFPTGMARVAQVTGALVVPVFQVGAPPDRMRVVIEEPWIVERGDDSEGALEKRVAAYAKTLEHHLLDNIPCWEHWVIEDTLTTIAAWPQRSLKERYEI
jgi:lauroyl/myristoyl acyltransferase